MAFVFHGPKQEVEDRISQVLSSLERNVEYQMDIRKNVDVWKGILTVHFAKKYW